MNPVFLQAHYWVLLEFVKLILFVMNKARLVYSFWPDMDKLVESGEDDIRDTWLVCKQANFTEIRIYS